MISARPALCCVLLVTGLLLAACSGDPDRSRPVAEVEPDVTMRSEDQIVGETVMLGPGEAHRKTMALGVGELLEAVVDQRGIDLTLRLLAPDGESVLEVDSPTGRDGDEHLLWRASSDGVYQLEIEGARSAKGPGAYLVRRFDKRFPGADDEALLQADRDLRAGRAHARAKQWRDAEVSYRAALAVWQRLGRWRREGETLRALGFALYAQQDRAGTEAAWRGALDRYRRDEDPRRAHVEHDLGRLALRRGATREAVERFERACSGFEAGDDPRGAVMAWTGLGKAWHQHGALQRALDAFAEARRHNVGLGRPKVEAALLIDEASLLLELDRGEAARGAYQRALAHYRSDEDARGMSAALRGVADASVRLGELDTAETAARASLDVLEVDARSRDRAAAWGALGNVHRKRGAFGEAIEAFEHALEWVQRAGLVRAEGNIVTALAQVRLDAGDPSQALVLFDRAAAIFHSLEAQTGEAMAMARGAVALQRLGRPREAWKRLEPALERVEQARGRTLRQDYRLSYFGSRQAYYDLAFSLLVALDRRFPDEGFAGRALAVHERRLAREIVEALTVEGDRPVIGREADLTDAIARRVPTAAATPDAAMQAQLETLHRLRARPRGVEPDAVPTPDAEAIRTELLDHDTLALVYVLGDEASHLMSLGEGGLQLYPLPPRAELEGDVGRLLASLRQTRARSDAPRNELAMSLGRLLLGPVAPLLGNRRLLIVPDGALRQLPFAALRHPSDPGSWVLERHEVVMVSSLSSLAAQRQAEVDRPSRARVVAFVDPVFEAADARLDGANAESSAPAGDVSRAVDTLGLGGLRRLAGTRREAAALERLWPKEAEVLRGFDANREAFLAQDWRDVDVLYIASHGLAHPQPELSGIVLSQLDRGGASRPGFLTSLDIARLHMPVGLVVLSACETGVGRHQPGEGQIGLAWSFRQAGAARLAVSLWQVDDRRTATLMEHFLRFYRDSERVPESLRRAQLVVAGTDGAQPFDWAGFVAFGDWRPSHRP